MKKLFITLSLALMATAVLAVPAKRGIWKTMKTSDGKEVRVEMIGDEHFRYWRASDGRTFVYDNGPTIKEVDKTTLQTTLKGVKRQELKNAQRLMAKVSDPRPEVYQGDKKGIVILAQFSDLSFQSQYDKAFYERVLNEENFSDASIGFKGSVTDYFTAQSNGQFNLKFDVYGPVTLPNSYSYYGQNSGGGDMNARVRNMIRVAVQSIKNDVPDWSVYDWDGDGEIDQVFVLYAGHGEADYYDQDPNTVWPHMFNLGTRENVGNGKYVLTYACSNEIARNGNNAGIGAFCHEFSHCMGFPDMYDTDGDVNGDGYGTANWDLMCSGSYNGDGFVPAGYTAYEKMVCGWKAPIVLTEPQQIDNVLSLADHGDTYIFYNDGNENEYYMIENRQQKGWDEALWGSGLLITHVDYDQYSWYYNTLNNDASHQRMVVVPADNDLIAYGSDYYDKMYIGGDVWPYGTNRSLTNTTVPAATTYNRNADGTYFMNKYVLDITQNTDGTMSFKFDTKENNTVQKPEGAVLYETFSMCNGTGGNDGVFEGTNVAMGDFLPDNTGWTSVVKYGGDKCARFGTTTQKPNITIPSFEITEPMTLTFKAAPFGSGNVTMQLSVDSGSAQLGTTSFTFAPGEWTSASTTVTGSGNVTLRMRFNNPIFLDDVCVMSTTSGISNVTAEGSVKADNRIYTVDGRYVGTDIDKLGKGLYIVNGKKIVK